MNSQTRGERLLAQIAHGLMRHGEERTAQTLGDRSTYIGLSDVGRAITCRRAAVASKLGLGRKYTLGSQTDMAQLFGRELTLQRGHWLESGLEPALRGNGLNLISQLEIHEPQGTIPIRAHVDFTLVWAGPRPAVRILELKSTAHLPDTLYPGYEAQVYGQIGMLAAHWDRPVFTYRNDQDGSVLAGRTFPELCEHLFGIAMPASVRDVDMEAWVLCVSMSEAKAFGPYTPNPAMLTLCRSTAADLWTATRKVHAGRLSLDNIATVAGFHPLCDWCDHVEGCPKFKAEPVSDPALDRQLAEVVALKISKTALENQIQEREDRIRLFCQHVGKSDWLSTGRFRFRNARMPGRKTLDSARLRIELINRIGEQEAEAVLLAVSNNGADYDRLSIYPGKA